MKLEVIKPQRKETFHFHENEAYGKTMCGEYIVPVNTDISVEQAIRSGRLCPKCAEILNKRLDVLEKNRKDLEVFSELFGVPRGLFDIMRKLREIKK